MRIREKTKILSWKKKIKVCYAYRAFILGFMDEIID
jgi:hypothetical protein